MRDFHLAEADLDSPGRQLPVARQMNLVLPYVTWAQAFGRAMKVLSKVFHRVDIPTQRPVV